MYGDNSAANALIKRENPEMTDAQIAFSIAKMKEYCIVDSGEALKRGITTELLVRGDSQLVIRQMQGKYKVNSPKLAPLHQCVTNLASQFAKIEFEHVYRDNNKRADALSNRGELVSP